MAETYELNIIIDDIEGEIPDNLMEMMKGIVDTINQIAPNLKARLEVWEPANLDDLPPVGIPVTDPQGRDMIAIPMNEAARRQDKATNETHSVWECENGYL